MISDRSIDWLAMKMSDSKTIYVAQNQACFQNHIIPFLLVIGGIVSDYLTSHVGLSMGFYEVHPQYHPLWGFTVFFSVITVLTVLLPRHKLGRFSTIGVALLSYLGTINNTLLILSF
jgi:hypothetical protein